MREQLLDCLRKLGQLNVDELQFVVENIAVLIFEFDGMNQRLFMPMIIKDKVENTDRVDRRKLKVPLTPKRLLLYGETGIENTSVFEEVLLRFLDLNDESFAVFSLAINIKNSLPVNLSASQILIAFI